MRKRVQYLDIASGIMIIWLLFYHALYPITDGHECRVFPFLYFFMPWFFYKSGYMFELKPMKELWNKDKRKLIKSFIIWSLIGYVIMLIWTGCITHTLTYKKAFITPIRSLIIGCSIPMNNALWFLLVLFIVRFLANWLLNKIKPIYILSATMGIYIILSLLKIHHLPCIILNTAWGLFFFVSGFLLKNHEKDKKIILISSIVYILSLFTEIPHVYSEKISYTYLIVLWCPVCTCACVFFNNLCRYIEISSCKLFSKTKSHLLLFIKYIGKNSMTFYVMHYLIFRISFETVSLFINPSWYDSWQGLVFCWIMYLIIIIPTCTIKNRMDFKRNSKELR